MIKNIKNFEIQGIMERWNEFFSMEEERIVHLHEKLLKSHELIAKDYAVLEEESQALTSQIKVLQQCVTEEKQTLANIRMEFDSNENEFIRQTFKEVHELQTQLIVLEQKESQLREEQLNLSRKMAEHVKDKDIAEQLRRKLSVAAHYLLHQDEEKEIISLNNNQQMIGLKILEAQENEKRRIAREIHDGPAQMLANMLMQYEFIDQSFLSGKTENALKEVKTLRLNIESTLAEMRRIIFDLRPMILDDLGLEPTINKQLLEMEKQAGIPIHLKIKGLDKRLSISKEVAIFRLIQESVQNALSHANASEVKVFIEMLPNHIYILVEDDGKGFVLDEKTLKSGSFGLLGMKERIEILKGNIAINSNKGTGTIIQIKIPIY